MNKHILVIAAFSLLASTAVAEETQVAATGNTIAVDVDFLKDLIANRDARKAEIDKIATVVDSGINVQMKKIDELTNEIHRLQANTKRLIQKHLDEINSIITGMASVNFRLKTLFPEQLKEIENITNYLKNL